MDQAGIVTLIDEALERFAGRDLVSSTEVVDLLLDLRLLLLAAENEPEVVTAG